MAQESSSFAEGLVGIVLDGRYRLDAVLGEGGMGSVFRAQHLAMDRRVAVKLLKPHLTTDAAALSRFASEARRTLRVDSPHAVKVLDFGVTEGKDYYIVLEYLDGRTVQRELEVDGPFAPARVIHIATQALHALGAAHRSGLVHRDIKPENILLMRDGDDGDYTKLLDFGVAKLMQGAVPSTRSAMAVTQQGMVFGTPEFMSPEQACGLPLDGRSDLYSLAATMFAMVTGRGLFSADTPIMWLMAHAKTAPPRLAEVDAELAPLGALDDLLQRCLAKHKEQRPESAEQLVAELAEVARVMAGGGDAAASSSAKRFKPMFSASVYVTAIADEDADAPPIVRPPTDAGAEDPPPRSRRGMYIGIGAALAASALIATTIVVATSKNEPSRALTASPAPSPSPIPIPSPSPIPSSASPSTLTSPSASPESSTSPPPASPSPSPSPALSPQPKPPQPPQQQSPPPRPPSAADVHVKAAEDAQRAGNRLRQMAEADAARKLEPGNAKATYLLADVLIAEGDTDRGCQYLHAIKHFPLAVARARSAGCHD